MTSANQAAEFRHIIDGFVILIGKAWALHYANNMMRRWLSLSIVVGLVGCAGSTTTVPEEVVDHFGNIPSFVLPTTAPQFTPPPPIVAPDEDDEAPPPTKKKKKNKKKKKKKPVVNDHASDPTESGWVTPGLEIKEPPAPNNPAPSPPALPTPAPPPVAQGSFTPVDTGLLSTQIDQGDIYIGDIDASTAQRVDCPTGMVATGISLVYDDNDNITGFQGISCRPLLNDGTLGTRTIVSQKLGSTQIPPGGASVSLGCNGERTDGIIDGYTVRYNGNPFISHFDLHCKSLQALWYRAHVAWTVTFSSDNGSPEQTKSKFATMTSDSYYQSCPDPVHHAIVSLHLRDNGHTDATGRLTGIGRICAHLKNSINVPTSTQQPTTTYTTGYFGRQGVKDKATPLNCPFGTVAIGLAGRAHDGLDAVGLVCRNRYTGEETIQTPVGGGSGGDFTFRCPQEPEETILRGVQLTAVAWEKGPMDTVIKRAGIFCDAPGAQQSAVLQPELWQPRDIVGVDYQSKVKFFTSQDYLMAPPHHAITGLQVKHGEGVNALAFTYQRLPWYASTNWFAPEKVHRTTMLGGVGGMENHLFCPPGEVAIGFHGHRAYNGISAIGLVCRTPKSSNDVWTSPTFGGSGGTPFTVQCPEQLVLQSVDLSVVLLHNYGEHPDVLEYIRGLGCADIGNKDITYVDQKQSTSSPPKWQDTLAVPNDGKHVITGLRIHAGTHVDAIGLFYHALE